MTRIEGVLRQRRCVAAVDECGSLEPRRPAAPQIAELTPQPSRRRVVHLFLCASTGTGAHSFFVLCISREIRDKYQRSVTLPHQGSPSQSSAFAPWHEGLRTDVIGSTSWEVDFASDIASRQPPVNCSFSPFLNTRLQTMAVDIQASNAVPGIVDDPRLAGRRILVAYGSETGNSQDAAETLERVAERLRFQTYLCEMNNVTFVSGFRGWAGDLPVYIPLLYHLASAVLRNHRTLSFLCAARCGEVYNTSSTPHLPLI